MELPQKTASFHRRVRYGRYVSARLQRSRREDLSRSALGATADVLATGRAWEDTEFEFQDALAVRDSIDEHLDIAARAARLKLAARGVNAVKESPYSAIFPEGVGFYTASPVSEQISRYEEFVSRLEAHLDGDDPVRVETVEIIKNNLESYEQALKGVREKVRTISLAVTELDLATREWERIMERVYGLLVADIGRQSAEPYFPRSRRRPSQAPTDDDDGDLRDDQ